MKLKKFTEELVNMKGTEMFLKVHSVLFCAECGKEETRDWDFEIPANAGIKELEKMEDGWEEEAIFEASEWKFVELPYEKNNILHLEISVRYAMLNECEHCKNKVFAENFSANYNSKEWRETEFHHGVVAYSMEESVGSYFQRIRDLHTCKTMQICTSTRRIGCLGVSVKGEVLLATDDDMWSRIDPDTGKRYIEYDQNQGSIVFNTFDLWERGRENDHTEVIMTNYQITAIWYTPNCREFVKKEAIKIAAEIGLGSNFYCGDEYCYIY